LLQLLLLQPLLLLLLLGEMVTDGATRDGSEDRVMARHVSGDGPYRRAFDAAPGRGSI
jgi:hypothetical protein